MSSFERGNTREVITLASDDVGECATSCEDPYVRPRENSSRFDEIIITLTSGSCPTDTRRSNATGMHVFGHRHRVGASAMSSRYDIRTEGPGYSLGGSLKTSVGGGVARCF